MKYYHLYMDRQGISRETHGKLLGGPGRLRTDFVFGSAVV